MAIAAVPLDDLRGPPLAHGEVHVWQLPLAAPPLLSDLLHAMLSPDEAAHAARFAFPELRARYAVAHGLARCVLAAYFETHPSSLHFELARHGKPRLTGRELAFNLSHSGDEALLAVALHEVGVDLEAVRPERDLLGLSGAYFSPAEAAALAALAPEERVAAFYRCWTRKEAYLKATGLGLALRLDSFEVSLARGEPPRLVRSERRGDVERWSFADPPAPPGFAAALAVEDSTPAVTTRRLVLV